MPGGAILDIRGRPGRFIVEVCADNDVVWCLAAVAWVGEVQVEFVVYSKAGRRVLTVMDRFEWWAYDIEVLRICATIVTRAERSESIRGVKVGLVLSRGHSSPGQKLE